MWSRLRQPLLFRLPPGYLVLIVLGVMVLLMVAYSAGYSQGSASTERQWRLRTDPEYALAMDQAAGRLSSSAGTAASGQGATTAGQGAGQSSQGSASAASSANRARAGQAASGAGVYDHPSQDPRKPGYRYYIIAHCSQEEAERLVAFLGQRGVDAAAVPVHNRAHLMVFVLTPFTREQIHSSEARELKMRILELGKIWASRTYRGPTNLSDLYLAPYNPRETQ